MERRNVIGVCGGAACTAGTAALLAGLNPALAEYHRLLTTLGGVSLLGGAAALASLLFTAKKPAVGTALSIPEPPPQIPAEPAREFLSEEITPKVLAEKVDGRTSMQVDAVLETYKGKWMRLSGRVTDVSKHSGDYYYVQFDSGEDEWTLREWSVGISFRGAWHDRMMTLNKGDWIEVEGRIDGISMSLALEDGRLLHVGRPPKPKALPAPRKPRAKKAVS